MLHSTEQTVLFPALVSKPVRVAFDEPDSTSDGGALLLKAVDERLGLTARMAACLVDPRQPGKVRHQMVDLVRQRVFGLACGYEDANDVGAVGSDPMHKLLLDRDPLDGDPLASQPTVSRFENQRRRVDLWRIGEALTATVIRRHRQRLSGRKAKLVTIDLDPTDDPVHGNQQLALFNGHYQNWCYLPLLGFVSFNDEPGQYLVAALLRPGNAHPSEGTIPLLRRLICDLRQAFPFAMVRVRLDGGFACPEIFAFLERQQVEYVIAMGKNSILERRSRRLLGTARRHSREQGKSAAVFGETRYAARTWPHQRRVIYKAEVVRLAGRAPRDNCRYVVTNLELDPEQVYEIYRGRGDCENRIKELKNDLGLGRLSCQRFFANQMRLLLTAAAYVLMQELRSRLRRTKLEGAQVGTLRLRLLKIGGRVSGSVRRVVVHLAASHPWQQQWRLAARAWGAAIP